MLLSGNGLLEMTRGDLQSSSPQKTACSAVQQLDAKSLAGSFWGAKQMAALLIPAAANSFISLCFQEPEESGMGTAVYL